MRHRFSKEEDDFIRNHYMTLLDHEIAERLGLSLDQVKGRRQWMGLKKGHRKGYPSGRRLFSNEQEQWLLDNNSSLRSGALAQSINDRFGTSFKASQIAAWRKNHRHPSGIDTRFTAGQASWTKGKTLEEICKGNQETLAAVRSTQFRKGNEPWNVVPIGTVITNSDGYKWIKVDDRKDVRYPVENWRAYHRWLWETKNGPIPEGMQLIFKNGDRSDCRMENLTLMTMRERGFYKGMETDDKELQDLAVAIARLKTRISERERNEEQKHRP